MPGGGESCVTAPGMGRQPPPGLPARQGANSNSEPISKRSPEPGAQGRGCQAPLTLWCSLTMFTRLRWNSLRRSSSRDADRCGRPSTFSSARRDTRVTLSTPEGHKPRQPRQGGDQSLATELRCCQSQSEHPPSYPKPVSHSQHAQAPFNGLSKEHPYGSRDQPGLSVPQPSDTPKLSVPSPSTGSSVS